MCSTAPRRTCRYSFVMSQGDRNDNVGKDIEVSSMSAALATPLVDLHACGICFQLYDESERLPKVLSCGHTNCLTCLSSWVKHSSSPFPVCSICRRVTRKPVRLLPNNFQLLQVLRRMKLTSAESQETVPDEQQNICSTETDNTSLEMSAVCDQVDEHMHEIASLLENQMDALSLNQEDSVSSDQGLLFRMIENSIADLLSRWESTKSYMLVAEKRKTDRSSSQESISMPTALSEISAVLYDALHDEIPSVLDFLPFRVPSIDDVRVPPSETSQLDGVYDYFGGEESDTLTHAYSDFSLFGSESRDTAVSTSQSSSREGLSYFVGWEESSVFPHISTFHGPVTTYSRCSLCQCRLSTSFASHQTHVRGRRHQQAIGGLTITNPSRRLRRRPQDESTQNNGSSINQSNRPSSASTGVAAARSYEPTSALASGRRNNSEGSMDQMHSSHQESNPRHSRSSRRNGRVLMRDEPSFQNYNSQRNNQASGAQRGARTMGQTSRRNTTRTPISRHSDNAEPNGGNQNSWYALPQWSTPGWGQPRIFPYEYVPEWSFTYGGYIQ
ncbi:hypothetical protein RB195_006673 [Necator americanus]|uniref:RING-type domain-containing protein n=1 Tax=Necator americanus TaxID=51031 RepID=A0ABR1BTR7_NECAM